MAKINNNENCKNVRIASFRISVCGFWIKFDCFDISVIYLYLFSNQFCRHKNKFIRGAREKMFVRQLEFVFWHRLNTLLLGYKYVYRYEIFRISHKLAPKNLHQQVFLLFDLSLRICCIIYLVIFEAIKTYSKGKWKVRLGTIKWLANNHWNTHILKRENTIKKKNRRRTEDKHPNKIDVSLVFDVGVFSLQITPETLSFPSITYPCK